MRRPFALLGLLIAALATGGCITATTLIRIRPDGSGTAEQTLLMNKETFAQLGGLLGMAGGGAKREGKSMPASPGDLISEAQAKEMAAKMGTGVRFVSRTPLTKGDLEGVRAVFAFDDINTVGVAQMPASPGGVNVGGRSEQPVRFSLTRTPDGNALLTATFPERPGDLAKKTGEAAPAAPAKPDPQQLATMQQLFKGLKVAIDVEVDGRLVKTSSPYVAGNRVSLLEIDFDQLLANPDALAKMGDTIGPGTSISDARALLKDVKGIKINDSTVTIEFAAR